MFLRQRLRASLSVAILVGAVSHPALAQTGCGVNCDSTWKPNSYDMQGTGVAPLAVPRPLSRSGTRAVVPVQSSPTQCVPSTVAVGQGRCVPDAGVFGPGKIWTTYTDGCGSSWGQHSACEVPNLTVTDSCLASGGGFPGETGCPTNSCFVYATGVNVGGVTDLTNLGRMGIGDITTDTTNNSFGRPGGGSMVGPGSYPDAYGSPGAPGPFYKAANFTLDGIAFGARTRVKVTLKSNGQVLLDRHGPLVINNPAAAGATFNEPYPNQPILNQFPAPSTRLVASDVGLVGPARNPLMGLWWLGGIPSGTNTAPSGVGHQYAMGQVSLEVTCDAR
jgi:hypothetical protein